MKVKQRLKRVMRASAPLAALLAALACSLNAGPNSIPVVSPAAVERQSVGPAPARDLTGGVGIFVDETPHALAAAPAATGAGH